MSKAHEKKNLQKRRTAGPLLAVSLAASLAAFGCTTNRNLGNGTPTRSGPDVRTAPTSGVTSGSEGETPVLPPPMTSATLTRADAAAAIMAQQQPARGRYLGIVNPGVADRGYVSDTRVTGQLIPPSFIANPQATINESISSGAGQVRGDALVTTTATTAAVNALPAGTFASGATLPTVASSGIPTVTVASSGATLPTVASSAIPTVTAASPGAPVQIVRGTSGAATITNTTPASPAPSTTSGNSN